MLPDHTAWYYRLSFKVATLVGYADSSSCPAAYNDFPLLLSSQNIVSAPSPPLTAPKHPALHPPLALLTVKVKIHYRINGRPPFDVQGRITSAGF